MKAVATMRRVPPQAWLFVAALVARLAAWPFSDVVDADAVTRALGGESYMRYPGWVGDGIWPPLHIYLSGAFTTICGSRVVGSVLVNILLGSALVFPVFSFTRRWAETPSAIAVTLVTVFNPLWFRNSLQGLSEVPFLFFAACAINGVAAMQSADSRRTGAQAVVAGACMTLACGMRYEGWLFILPLAGMLLIARQWRSAVTFALVASLFPAIWMITCAHAYGNPFSGVEHVVHWKQAATASLVPEDQLRLRTIFFPLSFLLTATPLLALLGAVAAGRALVLRRLDPVRMAWLLLSPCFLLLMVAKARHGELLLQHRFSMTLILLFIPYAALGFDLLKRRMLILAVAVVIIAWSTADSIRSGTTPWLSSTTRRMPIAEQADFIDRWTKQELRVIPRLERRRSDTLVAIINAVEMENKLVVLDFFGWQDTYNTGFRNDAFASSVVFLSPGERECDAALQRFQNYLGRLRDPQGVIALNVEGPCIKGLAQDDSASATLPLPKDTLALEPIGNAGSIRLFTFRLLPTSTLKAGAQ